MSSITREELKDSDGEVIGEVDVETLDAVTFEPSEALKAAITEGSVKTSQRVVEVFAKNKAGDVTRVYRQSYTKCTAENEAGALALPGVDGDEAKIWDFVSARADSNVYQPIYVRLRNAAQGPEKAVARMAKLFEGLTPSQREAAREALKAAGVLD